ncbi:MAG: hypothetical protein QXE06_04570 [Candidatus Bathyarchaeia archaeon]
MEEVVCVVEGVRAATGVYKPEDTWAFNEYDLFFTDKRLIFAVVHGPADWRTEDWVGRLFPEQQKIPESDVEKLAVATKYVKSYLKLPGDIIAKYKDIKKVRREQFKGKDPSEILGLHPDSFEIPYENVKFVKLSKSIFARTLEISALCWGYEKKFRFSIPKERFEDVKKVVDKYLHAKLVGK